MSSLKSFADLQPAVDAGRPPRPPVHRQVARRAAPAASPAVRRLTARGGAAGASVPVAAIREAQRQYGNRAVGRLLRTGMVQTRLIVNQPGDRYEQEADRVADAVLRMPSGEVSARATLARVQQAGPTRQTIAPLRGEANGAGIHTVPGRRAQRAAAPAPASPAIDAALEHRVQSPGLGQPLPASVRSTFEPRFGHDFSGVRVHATPQAQADAVALNARAFTFGSHIWVGAGESVSDPRLMAHELTHVVQQGGAVQRLELPITPAPPQVQRSIASDVLEKVAGVAANIPGFPLLTYILGRNPITDQPVERTPVNLIHGVMSLVPGGNLLFENLEKTGAITKAYGWLSEQISGLNLSWEGIKGLFRQAWDALSWTDVFHPIDAFNQKVKPVFAPTLSRIKDFALAAGKKVLEFIFEGALSMAGGLGAAVMGIVRKAGGVFTKIIEDPIGFIGNLVQAVKRGFLQFATNILNHLKVGLFAWLFGALAGAGLQLPDKFDLKGILSLVLQVLGLTYARLRGKLVALIGEKPVAFIEGAFDFLKTIVTQGLPAAWQKIVEYLGNLQEMVIGAIREWAVTKIVTAAITKLVSMFNPAGAIIQAILAVYNTVVFFIERAKQLADLATAVFDSVATIAAGNLGAAANYVEMTMARAIPVILGFLARFIGLGNVSEPIKKVIGGIQARVDTAMTRVATFIAERARGLFGKRSPDTPNQVDGRTQEQKLADLRRAVEEARAIEGVRRRWPVINVALREIRTRYQLTELVASNRQGVFEVRAAINPQMVFELVSNDGISSQIGEFARPRIEALPATATETDARQILEQARLHVAQRVTSLLRARVIYVQTKNGIAFELRMPDNDSIRVGVIVDANRRFASIANPMGLAPPGAHPNQRRFRNLVTQEEYVLAVQNLRVPRYLIRNVSERDVESMGQREGISPRAPGAERVKPREHVMGRVDSPYISATATPGGQITDPHGRPFNQYGQVRIDLMYLNPNDIIDLSTRVGQMRFELADPIGGAAQQAQLDVLRTQEILIRGRIPQSALGRI